MPQAIVDELLEEIRDIQISLNKDHINRDGLLLDINQRLIGLEKKLINLSKMAGEQ
ncbi:MAG: hypothetical protein LBC59_09375 [Chitinispirillales bacterium]|jgi:hypothetical protein|nr:hypothetical protein [Chitinispirillales bacterium]